MQKASFFLTRRPEPLPAYPKYSHLPAIILLLIECSLGKPRLICTPESGGHPPSTRSDPVAPCLGYASVNVQGWSGSSTFFISVVRGIRLYFWNTNPMYLFRISARALSFS